LTPLGGIDYDGAQELAEITNSAADRRCDRLDTVVIAVLCAVILYYFRQILWTDEYIYGELDIRRHFYFFKKVSYELMRGGELPLWIPHIYCGMPLLAASQVTPFYPVDLALMLTGAPLNKVFNWELLIHLMAAQVFSYLLFRRLLGSRIVAVFGAMWFWNVFFLNSIDSGDALNIRAMLLAPVVFYFVVAGMSNEGRPRDFLFGSLALSMQVLCGGLQNTFYTMAATAAYAVFCLAGRARRGDDVLRPAIGFAAMVFAGLAISSAQLLPAWIYSRHSVRSTGLEWFKVWALKPYQMIGYVVPMFEGRDREHGYFGLAPIVLAAFAVPFWKSPRKYFFLALGTLSIIYSFGGHTLISTYLAGLPLLRDFRGPFRGAIFFNLSVFALACGGMIGLMDRAGSGGKMRRLIPFGVVAAALVGGFIVTAACSRGYAGFSAQVVAASAFFMVLSIFASFVLCVSERFKVSAAIALVSLLAVDLAFNYGDFYSPTSVSGTFGRDWTIDFLEGERDETPSRIAAYNTAHTNYFGLVKHYVIYQRDESGRAGAPPVEGPENVLFLKPPLAPLPRVFVVHRFRILPKAEILDAMLERGFDPAREVILEEAPPGFHHAPDAPDEGLAKIVSHKANEVIIETESESDAILVLTESNYPGWVAEVDGRSAEVLTADYVFRAVVVPAGRHRVEFKFRPASFFLGAALSCVGTIGWLVWAATLFLGRKGP
jgi:hypothetical protein